MSGRGFNREVVALGSARMADGVANSFLVVVLPLYIASEGIRGETFGLREAAVTGLILAVFGVFNAFLQPFAGRLSDRVGRRRIFVVGGLVVLASLTFLYSRAETYGALFALRAGQGLSVAFMVTASVALVNEVSTLADRGGNMGIYNALRLLGFGSGPFAAGFVVEGGPYLLGGWEIDGFRAAFYLATGLTLLSAGLVTLLVRDPPRTRVTLGKMRIAVRSRREGHLLDSVFTLGVASFVMALCIALLASIEPAVNRRLGQDARWFGIQFGVFILSIAAVQPLVGSLSDRWGRKGFVVWGLVALVPTTLAQGLVGDPWSMLGARFAQGISGAMIFAPALALAGDTAPEGESGLQLSVLTMAFGLGISAGQLTSGFLVELGFVVPFAAGSALALLTSWIVHREVEEAPRG